jgi:hypothetical protein
MSKVLFEGYGSTLELFDKVKGQGESVTHVVKAIGHLATPTLIISGEQYKTP